MKKNIYCVGNAHLDLSWMWRWQEGSAEAKATIRSALDRMKEFDDFKFVCSSAAVFEWIEEFDPAMFEEIKLRVKEGRLIIVGGWYVQPDCNLPSGEGFARQSLYSQRYFKDKFGVTAKVGYNVDSFGHNGMLPQILVKSGMDSYVFMRPSNKEKPMDSNLFYWTSPDGSRVLAYRIYGVYNFMFGKYFVLEKFLNVLSGKLPEKLDMAALFYGVGNHGGGPTKKNIELLHEFAKKNPDKNIVFSDLVDFFAAARAQSEFEIPIHNDDLQHHASGCYSAYSKVKTDLRRTENGLLAAEAYSVLSNRLLGRAYPSEKLKEGWKDVCLIAFHDIAGGCCVKDAYIDESYLAGEALSIAAKVENNALQTLSWAVDTSDSTKGTPVVFFNPHPFAVNTEVQINTQASSVHDEKGEEVVYQYVYSQTHLTYRRCDTVFNVSLPAFGYATYYINRDSYNSISYKWAPELGRIKYKFSHLLGCGGDTTVGKTHLEDDYLRVEFDNKSGAVSRLFDKKKGRELLAEGQIKAKKKRAPTAYSAMGGVGVVIDESDHDTWSHGKNFFDNVVGYFDNAELTVTEKGPLRATVKAVSRYSGSTLTQYFTLQNDGMLRVKVKLDWHEKQKMLKLAYPLSLTNVKAVYEMPFGAIERPSDGEEECGQQWIAALGEEGGVAMLNDSKYSFSVKENVMNITAIRSPYYADHGAPFVDEECEVTDNGVTEFKYALYPYIGRADAIKRARVFNTPPAYVIENNHEGTLKTEFVGLDTDKDNVIVSSVKRAEDGKGLVLRAYEAEGIAADVTASGAILPAPLTARFKPYSVNTYYLPDGSTEWREVLLTEYDVE